MSAPRFITFGCRLNAFESEVMRGHAEAAGLQSLVVVNTCAVTGEAERQARQAIRRARRDHPHARIVVTGCAAQIAPEAYAAMPEVDGVLGNAEKLKAESFQALADDAAPRVRVADIMAVRETAAHLIDGLHGRARAFVEIQQGCDHRCTFCIIPFGRGPNRSVAPGEVVRQLRALAERGYAEVVLTGVDITHYGADLPGRPTLGGLVSRILKLVPELPRLRLSSLDPVEIDAALMRAIAEEERLMPHLHLSLQAGDDLILKRMKRRHLRADAVALAERVRRLRPGVAFGADLIAGFPTEDEAAFANTLALVEDCGLSYLHVFPYSARSGTPAARMPQLPVALRRERAAVLREAGRQALARHLDSLVGATAHVLVESETTGRTEDYAEVAFERAAEPGSVVTARLVGHDGSRLTATIDDRRAA